MTDEKIKPAMRKTGRPPKAKHLQKTVRVTVRFRNDELAKIETLQQRTGIKSRSDFMRHCVEMLDPDFRPVQIVRMDGETLRLLKSCANNLNQQTRKFNALSIPPSPADLGAVLGLLRDFLVEQDKRILAAH
ncbi:MAG: hypothetical protein V3V31_16185 [Methylococcales bacterium]